MTNSDKAMNMLTCELDQQWAVCIDVYESLSPVERGELAKLLLYGDIRECTDNDLANIKALAITAFAETGYRWALRNESGVSQ